MELKWNKLVASDYKTYPRIGKIVLAKIRHFGSGNIRLYELKRVKEGDCDWRTVDDNSELTLLWNVIAWVYSSKLK